MTPGPGTSVQADAAMSSSLLFTSGGIVVGPTLFGVRAHAAGSARPCWRSARRSRRG